MTIPGILILSVFTIIGIHYLLDMYRFSKGYEVNGKCRYGKAYARELENKAREKKEQRKEADAKEEGDPLLHDEITLLLAQLTVNP